jgi:hypothetical protein
MSENTSVYFAPYHSQPGAHLRGSTGRFREVEQAIVNGEWPYDNGDDPSFYSRWKESPLTWGVCRQNVRGAKTMKPGTVIVFFSYTKCGSSVFYRLSAVATVADVLDRRTVFSDPRFRGAAYLNVMLRPGKGGWRYDEDGCPRSARHRDWLWRMAVHGRSSKQFEARYGHVYRRAWFRDGEVPMAHNYILFSESKAETYVSKNPPRVAAATVKKGFGSSEQWESPKLQELTVDTAAEFRGRRFLRTANKTGRNVHPVVRFEMPANDVVKWRQQLIAALRREEKSKQFKFCPKMQSTIAVSSHKKAKRLC